MVLSDTKCRPHQTLSADPKRPYQAMSLDSGKSFSSLPDSTNQQINKNHCNSVPSHNAVK